MSNHGDRERLEHEIDRLLAFTVAPSVEEDVSASIARFLVILGNALVEATCRELAAHKLRHSTPPKILKFMMEALDRRFQNMKWESLLKLFAPFATDEKWNRFVESVDQKERMQFASLVGLRNQIAHGRANTPSVQQVSAYLSSARSILGKLRQAV